MSRSGSTPGTSIDPAGSAGLPEPHPSAQSPDRGHRSYDGTRRRQQSAVTRERIVTAGSELLHEASVRDWRAVTIRAVAERAGVNERTVYRHFGTERGLRDAVMHRLEEEAGVDLATMRLEDIAGVAAHIFDHVSSYPAQPRQPLDPTLSDASRRQRESLLTAVAARTVAWPEADRLLAAALFDMLWGIASYERLVSDWGLTHERSVQGITWVIRLVEEAVAAGRRPG